jgi:hypothetical protein
MKHSGAMVTHYWPEDPSPDELGVVVHGPAIVARAPGIAVAVSCVFARPTGLSIGIVLRATGARAEAARRETSGPDPFDESEGWPDGSELIVTFGVDGTVGIGQPREIGSSTEGYLAIDMQTWVDALPSSGQLTVTAAWSQAGLPEGGTTLTLTPAEDLEHRVIRIP